MSKELEAIKELRYIVLKFCKDNNKQDAYCIELCDMIEKELQRLEVIDNANPNEALECVNELWQDINVENNYRDDFKRLKTIEQSLLELKAIKEAKPSKAMECLERVSELQYIDHWESREEEIEIIEQVLNKAQEQEKAIIELLERLSKQEKVLEIIKEKDVNFEVFGAFETYEDYEIYYNNKFHLIENKLTQEEFELLKEYLEK